MGKVLMAALAVLTLSSCGDYPHEHDIHCYSCSEDALALIEKQYRTCSETNYLESYCYKTAVFWYCELRHTEESE
jgi:hypothetical protein